MPLYRIDPPRPARVRGRQSRNFWKIVGATCLLGSSTSCSETGADGERPSVILVSIDSLRADHLGCYGYPRETSPTIDDRARAGVRFQRAYSTTSWTLPAHAALFTSLHDSAHGLVDNGLKLAESQETLAEIMQDAGYLTAGFFGGPYLHPVFGLDQGFEVYENCMAGAGNTAPPELIRLQASSAEQPSHKDVTGPRLLEKVTHWSQEAGAEPYFLFLHFWDVHYDYIPPERYVQMFDPDYTGDLDPRDFNQNQAIHAGMDPRDLQYLQACYDGEIRFTDDILKQVLEQLQRDGRMENTLLVVLSDHGEEFFEHGGKGHQRTLFEEVLEIPLLWHWPGHIPEGEVVADLVSLVDVAPTLLSLVGLPVPGHFQGRDLSPLWQGGSLPETPVLTELLVNRMDFRALRTSSHKLIAEDRRRFTVYDLKEDPGELRPLAAKLADFDTETGHLRQRVINNETLRRERGGAEPLDEMTPEMLQTLRNLGYLPPQEESSARGRLPGR